MLKSGGTLWSISLQAQNETPFYMQTTSNTNVYPTERYEISAQTFFTPQNIIGARNIALNPKLLSPDFHILSLESADGQKEEYDMQKLAQMRLPNDTSTKAKFHMLYTEILTPEATKGYLRIQTTADTPYGNALSKQL
jgi:hypothetical protein